MSKEGRAVRHVAGTHPYWKAPGPVEDRMAQTGVGRGPRLDFPRCTRSGLSAPAIPSEGHPVCHWAFLATPGTLSSFYFH